MATTYRYLFADLVTNQIIAELPLTGVSFTQQLNQAGTFQGRLLLSGVNADALNVDTATIPARNAIYVDRDNVIVWGGIIWGREYNSTSQTLSITAREFISYFERRRINTTIAYTSTDQLTIAQNLVQTAQTQTYGDIGIIYNTNGQTTSGILIDRVYYNYELKSVFQAIQDLSRQTDGFDFHVDVYYQSGSIIKAFNTYYPRFGGTYDANDPYAIVFNMPGNIVEYVYPEDGSIAANKIYSLGAGSNEGKLISIATDSTKFIDGWALLEDQANYSDITDQIVLDELATGRVTALSYPPTIVKVIVPAYEAPVYGTYEVGDSARLIITDSRFPNTLDEIYRIVGLSVQPGEDGPERVTVTLTTGTE
jgi:hypothetical protein